MSYGTDIAAALPAVLSAEPSAAQALRSWCDEVDARLTAKLTPAGLNVNADVDFASYGLGSVQHVGLAAASATKTGAGNAGKLYRYNGELYYTNSSGTTVRLTNAGQIDVGSVQGITGDYSADANAEVDYTTSSALYRFLSNLSTLTRANVEVGTLRLYGTGASPSFRATLSPGTLAASYTMTLPTNVPVSTSLLQWTSAGLMQSTRSPDLDAPTLATPIISGKATFSTEFAHPTRSQHFGASLAFVRQGTGTATLDSDGGFENTGADGAELCIQLPLVRGQIVQSIDFHVLTSANAGTRTFDVGYYNETVGALTFPGGAYSTTYTGTSTRTTRNLNVTDFTVAAVNASGTLVGLVTARFTAIAGDHLYGITVNYVRT